MKFKQFVLMFSVAGLFVLFLSLHASAKPAYFNQLQSTIPNAQLTFRCQTCHQNVPPRLNPFGQDFSTIKRKWGMDWSQKYWADLKSMDSDKDGMSNEQEILSGRNPGKANQ